MADQENINNDDLDNLDPILDEDSFSLELEDFDLGDDLEASPDLELPSFDEVADFEEEDSNISNLVISRSDETEDDLLDIDLDSDFNLLGDEDPVLPEDDGIHFNINEPMADTPSGNKKSISHDDDLELEFDDNIIDLDKEIEAILNGEDGILTNKRTPAKSDDSAGPSFNVDDEDDGPIALSMEELESITGGLLDESEDAEDFNEEVMLPDENELEYELGDFSEESASATDDYSEIDLDLDDSEIDTTLSFDEEGHPDLVLDEEDDTNFTPLRDAEEEEIFGSPKEDENLTLSDDELGNILGSDYVSLEESLASDEDFLPASEIEPLDGDENIESISSLSDEEDDGPITLSLEELDNISPSEEPELNMLDEDLEDETITLSSDELGEIIGDNNSDDEKSESGFDVFGNNETEEDLDLEEERASSGLEGEYEETQKSDLLAEDDDEGPLALSMEELESIAGDAEESSEEEELMDSLDRAPMSYEEEKIPSENNFLEEDLEDESIALSMEELENITGTEDIDFIEPESNIETISGDKIDDLIGEEIPGENLEDIGDLPMEESDVDVLPPTVMEHRQSTLGSDDSAGIEIHLDDYALEGKQSALEELHASEKPMEEEKPLSVAAEEAIADAGSELSIVERKKVFTYLDTLLGNLPDEVIREFSKSQYFDLYKKLMKELGL